MAKKLFIKNPKAKTSVDQGIKKLKVLITIVDRTKALFYTDLLEQYEINMQMVIYGKGTADREMLDLLGFVDNEKAVIISVVREDIASEVLEVLAEKFVKIKNGKGIAFTIPMRSLIGVSVYQFLSNDKTMKKEEIANA